MVGGRGRLVAGEYYTRGQGLSSFINYVTFTARLPNPQQGMALASLEKRVSLCADVVNPRRRRTKCTAPDQTIFVARKYSAVEANSLAIKGQGV